MRTTLEAACLLGAVNLLLIVSPRRAMTIVGRALSGPPRRGTGPSVARLADVVWGFGRLRPLRGTCLSRAITLCVLARRAGVDAVLKIGVRRDGDTLAAHAWVEVDGRTVPEQDLTGYEPIWGSA